MRSIKKIIIHCSASDMPGQDRWVIREWHLARGFKDIGYHYLILKAGEIQKGRPVASVGAHCEGQNHDSIGICLVGLREFNERQFESLYHLVREYRLRFPGITVHPHNEFNKNKECPVFDIDEALRRGEQCLNQKNFQSGPSQL